MLSEKKRHAVELLFEETEGEVAKKLKVSLETLVHWIEELEFRDAINGQMKGYQRSTTRMLSLLYLECCRELGRIIHDKEDKTRHKVALDLLKAGGILREGPLIEGDDDPVADMLRRMEEEDEVKEMRDEEDGEDAETR